MEELISLSILITLLQMKCEGGGYIGDYMVGWLDWDRKFV